MSCSKLEFVSTGKNSALFIKTIKGHNILIGTGTPSKKGQPEIIKYFNKRNIKRIDLVVAESNKAQKETVDKINEQIKISETVFAEKTESIKIDEITINIEEIFQKQKNTNAALIKVLFFSTSVLISGNTLAEDIKNDKIIENTDILVLPEYDVGYEECSSYILNVNPDYIIANTDKTSNQAYTNYNVLIYQTDVTGTIFFKVNKKGIKSFNSLRSRKEEY